jgi:hypothetical protein
MMPRQQCPPQQNQISKTCPPWRAGILARRSARHHHTTPPATSNREPDIKNHPNSRRIITNPIPNRENPPSLSTLELYASSFQNLIGPPVIRIRSNSLRIRENFHSNRHERPSVHPGRFSGTASRCKRIAISRHRSAGSGSLPTPNVQPRTPTPNRPSRY